jgi:two-component system, OmpR family, phosphate regulon sensor histidine kinase PhoR
LQIARLESGQQSFELTNVPVAPLIDECAEQFAEIAATKQISLTAELCDRSLAAWADEEGVRTILTNLVDNAIKYTPNGGAVVIRAVPAAASLTLEVADTGIGIAEKDLARIFERFYRVDKARSRELGGTGLGLSIVKHLAQSFGGNVSVESQLHKGTTFRVELPAPVGQPSRLP